MMTCPHEHLKLDALTGNIVCLVCHQIWEKKQ